MFFTTPEEWIGVLIAAPVCIMAGIISVKIATRQKWTGKYQVDGFMMTEEKLIKRLTMGDVGSSFSIISSARNSGNHLLDSPITWAEFFSMSTNARSVFLRMGGRIGQEKGI